MLARGRQKRKVWGARWGGGGHTPEAWLLISQPLSARIISGYSWEWTCLGDDSEHGRWFSFPLGVTGFLCWSWMMIENPAEWKVISGRAIFILLLSNHLQSLGATKTPCDSDKKRRLACSGKQEQLKTRLKVLIYLSKSVFTIFSNVSSHLRRGLVIPHCRDLLYSFRPKYSFSSQLMSSWFKTQSKTGEGRTQGVLFSGLGEKGPVTGYCLKIRKNCE